MDPRERERRIDAPNRERARARARTPAPPPPPTRTGEESEEFLRAHVAAAALTGEPFATPGYYDFATARLTERTSPYLATMLAGRSVCLPHPSLLA